MIAREFTIDGFPGFPEIRVWAIWPKPEKPDFPDSCQLPIGKSLGGVF
jgi:hypothetical protein